MGECGGPGGLLPLSSAPQTSPAALLGHQDGLTGLTIAFHLGSGGAGAAATVDVSSVFGAHVGFSLQKGAKRIWARSWAPSDLFPDPGASRTTEHGMPWSVGRADAHAGHAACPCTPRMPM